MLKPILKPWAGVGFDFRTFRTEDPIEHGVFDNAVGDATPIPGAITMVVTIADDADLKSGHVAHRMSGILASKVTPEWKKLEEVVFSTLNKLANLHGLGAKEHHHVASAHTGRDHAHAHHVTENMLAEYLLLGHVSLHHSGGVVKVDDGKRKWTAYAQPGYDEEHRSILELFPGAFDAAAKELLTSVVGKVLVA